MHGVGNGQVVVHLGRGKHPELAVLTNDAHLQDSIDIVTNGTLGSLLRLLMERLVAGCRCTR